MALKLIDRNATTPIDVDGTVFNVRQMTNGEKIALAQRIQELQDNQSGYDSLMCEVAKMITSIDDAPPERSIEDIVVSIADVDSQQRLVAAIFDVAGLSDAERKNSHCSSGRCTCGRTGTPEIVDDASQEDVSDTEL